MVYDLKKSLALGGIVGWLSVLCSAFIFVMLGRPSEIGRAAFFVFWSVILSFCYVVDFLLIAVPFYTVLKPKLKSLNRCVRCLLGGALFAGTVPVWSAAFNLLDEGDLLLHGGLAFIGGAASAYFVKLSKTDEA